MNNPALSCRGNSFMRFANEAAERERASDYGHAARLWMQATKFPASKENLEWAACRAETCNHLIIQPRPAID